MTPATVVLDHKFRIDSAGRICATTMFGDSFWARYLTAFDSVRVICRARPVSPGEEVIPITDDRLSFFPVPYYEGPFQYARLRKAIRNSVAQILNYDGVIILRAPQILPMLAYQMLRKQKRAFGAEVVADPWDLYAPGAERNPLRPFFRRHYSKMLKRLCVDATATSYVTERALQLRYPPQVGSLTTHCSSVEISKVVEEPRTKDFFEQRPLRLLFVGAMNRLYKGQDTLLDAFQSLVGAGFDVTLTMVGDGQYRGHLEQRAQNLGISKRVLFTGNLPFGKPVLGEMDRAHVFVLPSRQEGIARTVIESYSRGLPCFTSNVGGMPEVVPEECMVEPGNARALFVKLASLLANVDRLVDCSQRGLETARGFIPEKIEHRRQAFYKYLRDSCDP